VEQIINFTKTLDLISKSGYYHTHNTILVSNLKNVGINQLKTTIVSEIELMCVLEELNWHKIGLGVIEQSSVLSNDMPPSCWRPLETTSYMSRSLLEEEGVY
jgi:hypothetical protein